MSEPAHEAEDRRRASTQVLLGPDEAADLDRDLLNPADDITHHLLRVLRLRDGESVAVTDGAGRWRLSVARVAGSALMLEATGVVHSEERGATFTLATAIPKGDRVDFLVQKTVELGVDRVAFVDAERSVVQWKGERAAKQIARLQRIADEATRQSRRVWRTDVVAPVPLETILVDHDVVLAEPGGTQISGDEAVIAVGPEGGWSDREVAAAAGTVGLGPHILRLETAAIAVATLRLVR